MKKLKLLDISGNPLVCDRNFNDTLDLLENLKVQLVDGTEQPNKVGQNKPEFLEEYCDILRRPDAEGNVPEIQEDYSNFNLENPPKILYKPREFNGVVNEENQGIQDTWDFAFQGHISLRVINLSKNYLRIVRKEWFKKLQKLEQLDLSENLLDTIEEGAFLDNWNLKQV
jgi:hypothetical protein